MLREIRNNCKIKKYHFFLIPVFLFVIGCAPGPYIKFHIDVTTDKELWERCNFRYMGFYQLKDTVFIEYDPYFKRFHLGPTLEYYQKTDLCVLGFYTSSCRLSDYEYDKNICNKDILGILSKNTKIQMIRIERYVTLGYGGHNNIFATIIDGPFAGKEVEITDLTIGEDSYIKNPNPELLSLVPD